MPVRHAKRAEATVAIASKPWSCLRCGVMADVLEAHVPGMPPPQEDDICLCDWCGAPYHLHGGKWLAETPAEQAAQTPAMRHAILCDDVQRRVAVALGELSKRASARGGSRYDA